MKYSLLFTILLLAVVRAEGPEQDTGIDAKKEEEQLEELGVEEDNAN